MTIVLVILGAAVGAPLRYLTGQVFHARHNFVIPWQTFTVNLAGSFLLGFLLHGVTAHQLSDSVYALLGTGFCGALTTYSTFSWEAVQLFQKRAHAYALIYVTASIFGGLGAAFCGITAAAALWP